jgi:hypothetical protein
VATWSPGWRRCAPSSRRPPRSTTCNRPTPSSPTSHVRAHRRSAQPSPTRRPHHA